MPTKADGGSGGLGGVQGRSVCPVGRVVGARRPAEAGPWGLSEGSVCQPRGCASGMGMWACSEGGARPALFLFIFYSLFFIFILLWFTTRDSQEGYGW